jgi:probable rRNA maturation factor
VIAIDIANTQTSLPLDERRLQDAVRMILEEASIAQAQISVAVVDDPTIAKLHETYLHDSDPTDVLSFVLESRDDYLEGEVVVSADTAAAMAPGFGWSAADELLLYVIHGTLHLVGCDDATPPQQAQMRAKEQACLAHFGLQGHYESSPTAGPAPGGKEIP